MEIQLRVLDAALPVGSLSREDSLKLTPLTRTLSHPLQFTMECLANIGIQPEGEAGDDEHGQKGIFILVAAVMHLLNVGFQKGETDRQAQRNI